MRRTQSHPPIRTCAGCGARAERDALARFAADGPHLVADVDRQRSGRGVSVHPRRACVDAAAHRGGFARSLRRPVRASPPELARTAAAQYRDRAERLLAGARRNGAATVDVQDAIAARDVRLLVVARDAAESPQDVVHAAERLGRACVVFGTRASLGRSMGRPEVGALSISSRKIAEQLARAVWRASALEEVERSGELNE